MKGLVAGYYIHVVMQFHSLGEEDYDFLALLAAPGVVDPVVRDLLLAGLAGFDGDG